jgi:hypothetical protein
MIKYRPKVMGGKSMPANLVNLDALIRREDFDVTVSNEMPPSPPQMTTTIQITDVEPGRWLYQVLRKPDFQRETANWEPVKVVDLIQSFVEGDLIPSIILWRSRAATFLLLTGLTD